MNPARAFLPVVVQPFLPAVAETGALSFPPFPSEPLSFQIAQHSRRDNIQPFKGAVDGAVTTAQYSGSGGFIRPSEPLPFHQFDNLAHCNFLIGSSSRKREHEGSAVGNVPKRIWQA